MVNTFAYLSEGFLLGLATGHICIATCGPIYAPYLMQKNRSAAKSVLTVLEISGGRFLSYIAFGAVVGFSGMQISAINRQWFTTISYILCSAYLLVTVFRTHRSEKGCALKRWSRFSDSPVLLGIVTGINFCPSFLIALIKAVDLSGPVAGMFLFAAFFFGTNVFIIPISFLGLLGRQKLFRTIGRIAAVVIASWFIGKAGIGLAGLSGFSFDRRPVISIMDATDLYVVHTDSAVRSAVASAFAAVRPGRIFEALPGDTLPESCYIVTGSGIMAAYQDRLQAANRFVIITPGGYEENGHTRASADRFAQFLSTYHFLFNKKTGSRFQLPATLLVSPDTPSQHQREE